MAPRGPILPRRAQTASQARSALENSAYQVGVLLAIQRNRKRLRQEDLAAEIKRTSSDISTLERGRRLARPLTDAQVKRLFSILDLGDQIQLKEFFKWWQRHGRK
jgi:ribosome-binding protein aMBF1 (putative translation factor)